MLKDLKQLIDLNKIDQRIHLLNQEKKSLPLRISEINSQISREEKVVNSNSVRMEELSTRKSELDAEIRESEECLRSSEEKQKIIKTNEEYDAVHNEIGYHKKRISDHMGVVLGLSKKIAELSPKIEESEEKLQQTSEGFKKELADLNAVVKQLDDRIATADTEKVEASKDIGAKYLGLYKKLLIKSKDAGIIGFVTDEKRYCGVCSNQHPPQSFILIKRNNSLQRCEQCGAINIWLDKAQQKEMFVDVEDSMAEKLAVPAPPVEETLEAEDE